MKSTRTWKTKQNMAQKIRPHTSSSEGANENVSHEDIKTERQRVLSDHSVGRGQSNKKLKKA